MFELTTADILIAVIGGLLLSLAGACLDRHLARRQTDAIYPARIEDPQTARLRH